MQTQQHYTLNQMKELAQAGFLPISEGDNSLSQSSLTNSDKIHTLFLSQIQKWGGKGMNVKLGSEQKCSVCKLKFKTSNEFQCEKHNQFARRVYIEITGLKKIDNHSNNRERIFSDQNEIPLSIESAIFLKKKIISEIEDGTFTIKRFLPKHRKIYLFKNYKMIYLEKMEKYAALPYGHDKNISKKHLKNIKAVFKNYLHYFDDYDIQDIKHHVIGDWLEELQLSNNYKKSIVGYLMHLFSWALGREDLMLIPKKPKIKFVRKKKKGVASDIQLEIVNQIPDKDKPLFEFHMETGRRKNEGRALRVRDLTFFKNPMVIQNRIKLYGKYRLGGAFDLDHYKPFPKVEGHAGEEYPINKALYDILRRALSGRNYGAEDYVFLNKRDTHFTDNQIDKIFQKARKKAGYPSLEFNVFSRHSKGLHLKNAGASDEQIAEILGNTAKIVRETYTHVEFIRKAEIINIEDKRKAKNQKVEVGWK